MAWRKLKGIDRWESDDDQVGVGRIKDQYRVYSIYGKFKDKKFKSKSQAMAYARSYMRKH